MRFCAALLLLLPLCLHAMPACREDARLSQVFDDMHLVGSIVVFDTLADRCSAHDVQRAQKAYSPASTFKIFNAMTALETGVIRDEHETFHWDGKQRDYPDWNRDHDLASGMQFSVVWYYQELARRIGAKRMQEWIDKVGYGNRNIGGGIDQFWLSGGALRITALQIEFLQRLHDGTLPFSTRSQDIVKRILIRDQTLTYTLRFKTGYTGSEPPALGWIVGWIERDGHVAYFATNIDMADGSYAPKREALARAALHVLGWLPESAATH